MTPPSESVNIEIILLDNFVKAVDFINLKRCVPGISDVLPGTFGSLQRRTSLSARSRDPPVK